MSNRPKSARIRLLEGNAGHRQVPVEPNWPVMADLDPPSWLTGATAQKFWRDLAPPLVEAGIVTELDRVALALLADALAAYVRRKTAANLQAVRLLALEFGLTPASRTRIVPVQRRAPRSAWDALDELDPA